MKHKYYISCSIPSGFIGLYYCLDYTLDTIDGIQKMSEQLKKEGYDAVILFFKELEWIDRIKLSTGVINPRKIQK